MPVTDLLRRMFLFADLRDDELVALADCLRRRVFAKDAILFHQGGPARNLYLIESGAVRLFALGEMGRELTLDVYGPGECIGETSLLDGNPRIVSAAALEKTVIYTMNRDDFLHCLELHPQMAWRVMVLLARRLEQATAYAENLVFLDVAGRVAAVMVELAARYGIKGSGIELDAPLTQADLASWVGASREMVNKVLHAYRDQGLITMQGHKIVITDLAGLKHKMGR
jgi:CRP/FNR family transcriptional regulator, cyclic AMP receptor protein